VAAILLSSAAWCAEPNPITNGGFETVGPGGTAPGWQFLGNGVVESSSAYSGRGCLKLVRAAGARGETGLNRAWTLGSGRQGSMLAERKGAVRFRYRAVTQQKPGTLVVQIIPMDGEPLEFGGRRTSWRVPGEHVGDGQWHLGEFAYDYTAFKEVKWVHVSARVLSEGELWLDAFEWVPEVDAVPQIAEMAFKEQEGRYGQAGTVEVTLKNLGSRAMPAGTARLALPKGLSCAPAVMDTPAVSPGESVPLVWAIEGPRLGPSYTLTAAVSAGGRSAAGSLTLERSVSLQSVRLERAGE